MEKTVIVEKKSIVETDGYSVVVKIGEEAFKGKVVSINTHGMYKIKLEGKYNGNEE